MSHGFTIVLIDNLDGSEGDFVHVESFDSSYAVAAGRERWSRALIAAARRIDARDAANERKDGPMICGNCGLSGEHHDSGLCDSCETQDAYDRAAEAGDLFLAKIPVGTHVRLRQIVDRYPHFSVEAGATGVVVQADADLVRVRMDEKIDGAETWDNEIVWSVSDGDDPEPALEVVGGRAV